jgi:hypothetical protein
MSFTAGTDEELKPTADLAFAGDGNFLCGECVGFCKQSTTAAPETMPTMELARYDFKLPPLLTDEEVEEILTHVDDLVSMGHGTSRNPPTTGHQR